MSEVIHSGSGYTAAVAHGPKLIHGRRLSGIGTFPNAVPLHIKNTWWCLKLLTLFKNIYYIIYVHFLKEACKYDVSFPLGAEELQALLHQRHP